MTLRFALQVELRDVTERKGPAEDDAGPRLLRAREYRFLVFGALRWNQQFFSDIDFEGGSIPWGRDNWRIDSALGYRFTPNTQLKLQYGLQSERWNPEDYEHLLATQFTARF